MPLSVPVPGLHPARLRPTSAWHLQRFLCVAALAVSASWAGTACAAPEEIQVYLDDTSAQGKFGVDVHNNFVFQGARVPGYVGEQPPAHTYRLTPEFYYGLTDTLEAGLYVLTTRPSGGDAHVDGVKARIKYIAPHDKEQGVFVGANLEVGRSSLRVSPTPWNAELKGILGYRTGPWMVAINPNVDWSLSPRGGPVSFGVDAKLAYAINAKSQIGLESYNELGPIAHPDGLGANGKYVFAVLDQAFERFDLNIGLGKGVTQDADRWLLKFIVGTHF